ncbi:MAG: hypothetical protein IPJ31_00750 [Bacteroidetes bacterium]|nr:hypothetical protein [Bacteroidota bacterium]MBP6314751.1 hypothetical protein [Chitinophagaceae bacterium]
MNINEVPQDKKQFMDGANAPKKVMYVTTDEGTYTQFQSDGWEAENLVLEQTWEDIEQMLETERQKVISQQVSPISYYMIKNRMDIAILSSYVSKWQWQVKRHLNPAVFKKLPEKLLSKYATVFDISVEELKNFGQ